MRSLLYVALPFVLQSISQLCDLCLTAVVSSPCFACAGTGARKKFSRAAPCKERALRHHAAFIEVSVPLSHLVVLFSITLGIVLVQAHVRRRQRVCNSRTLRPQHMCVTCRFALSSPDTCCMHAAAHARIRLAVIIMADFVA